MEEGKEVLGKKELGNVRLRELALYRHLHNYACITLSSPKFNLYRRNKKSVGGTIKKAKQEECGWYNKEINVFCKIQWYMI